jgi:hypothetical protein
VEMGELGLALLLVRGRDSPGGGFRLFEELSRLSDLRLGRPINACVCFTMGVVARENHHRVSGMLGYALYLTFLPRNVAI